MITRLNADQARRLSKMRRDYDQSLNAVYEAIRARAVQGYWSCTYIASALPKADIGVILESLTKDGYFWEYDRGWKIIRISWKKNFPKNSVS